MNTIDENESNELDEVKAELPSDSMEEIDEALPPEPESDDYSKTEESISISLTKSISEGCVEEEIDQTAAPQEELPLATQPIIMDKLKLSPQQQQQSSYSR